uniref:Secreted protein n=1 Tax=Cyanothece sp. (strain PCC 7425 / ATCC 29141) TaxID=395961 RepID=B8HXM4_CYAP4
MLRMSTLSMGATLTLAVAFGGASTAMGQTPPPAPEAGIYKVTQILYPPGQPKVTFTNCLTFDGLGGLTDAAVSSALGSTGVNSRYDKTTLGGREWQSISRSVNTTYLGQSVNGVIQYNGKYRVTPTGKKNIAADGLGIVQVNPPNGTTLIGIPLTLSGTKVETCTPVLPSSAALPDYLRPLFRRR